MNMSKSPVKRSIPRTRSSDTLGNESTSTAFGLKSVSETPEPPTAKVTGSAKESSNSKKKKSSSKRKDLEGCRELYTLEFKQGDIPRKFVMHLPPEVKPGELIENIGGQAMSVRLPDDIQPGEKVILIASYPKQDEIESTKTDQEICGGGAAVCVSPNCKQS
jgi:hypothetical protein